MYNYLLPIFKKKHTLNFIKVSSQALLIVLITLANPVVANAGMEIFYPDAKPIIEVAPKDPRVSVLEDYFSKHNSPLKPFAKDFIEAADEYNLDWKLVASIAGVESTFGKKIPGGYNAWGWGIYGNNRLGFNSWRDGIFTVTKGLRENYVNKGYTEPYSMNKIYASSPLWGWKVSYFMGEIDTFSKSYKVEAYLDTKSKKSAGDSAKLEKSVNYVAFLR